MKELRRDRPRRLFLRISGVALVVLVAWAWVSSGPLLGRLPPERRWQNMKNFVAELVPTPVEKTGDWSEAIPWAGELLAEGGLEALGNTLGIATAAIILSAIFVLTVLPLASRQLARRDPFGLWAGRRIPWMEATWNLAGRFFRFLFVLARSVPEYLIAYLLLSLLGLQVWPLVLALAIHNFGILGRLWGEVVENADTAAGERAAASGAGRYNAFATTTFPEGFNRFLIYFFYRWETCVKDATVLGMLGLLTLGKLVALSKGLFWDRMFFYILLASCIILIGDLFSTFLRRRLR